MSTSLAESPDATTRYLDLLKAALSFTLWPEPPIPIERFHRPWHRQLVVTLLSRLLRGKRLQVVRPSNATQAQREAGVTWPAYADRMIGVARLNSLQHCVETVLREGVPGDLIETGVWRGGACILMRAVLAAHGVRDRQVFVADSFDGCPPPDPEKHPADRGDAHHAHRYLAVSEAEVRHNFARYGLLDGQVTFLRGWFKDSLPTAPIGQLAVLRLDGDLYGSTMDALTALYPRLSRGGFCIIDDYSLPACQAAVDEYRQAHNVTAPMMHVDWTCRVWRNA